MKMPAHLFSELSEAIDKVGGMPKGATMRQRWDLLHATAGGGYNHFTLKCYKAGLNDDHIDTALRALAK